jgi:hypothetical protein
MSEPYYESDLTGDVVAESDLAEVTVYRMEAEGHDHFEKEVAGVAYVESNEIPGSVTSLQLYMAHGGLVSVYRGESTYGRAYAPEEDHIDSEKWETVGKEVLSR